MAVLAGAVVQVRKGRGVHGGSGSLEFVGVQAPGVVAREQVGPGDGRVVGDEVVCRVAVERARRRRMGQATRPEVEVVPRPEVAQIGPVSGGTGRDGRHSEAMGRLLAEMQVLQRSFPGGVW